MGQYFARVIRALVVAVLGFGGGIGLMIFIAALITSRGKQASVVYAFGAALVLGFAFAVIGALVLLLTDLTSRLFAAKGHHHEIWELVQVRSLDFEGELRDLKHCCRQGLLSVPHVKSVTDADEYKIDASVGLSWRSPGEHIEVSIAAPEPGKWRATCTSRCLAAYIAFDYAKNFENVETWLKSTQACLKEVRPA
jgi:hypothetical protein